MAQKFDFIIVGGGPNGLTIGAYLAKAGQKCLLLEKRFEVGGGLMTEQVTLPDFFHNTHAIYHMMVDYAPIYSDLNFDEYLVRHIKPELQWALPLKDGRCLCIYTDVEKT
ncbi:MAG: NAD(P)-binding protein, partial [Dehalococcoidia bacterium]|nr:NAD(P)-binding protein [Dehalococcoidia bacterium]MDM7999048.1 NAD(P)-binding protein [Dehalococcoidia bacterium]